jgi:hypothetical protein
MKAPPPLAAEEQLPRAAAVPFPAAAPAPNPVLIVPLKPPSNGMGWKLGAIGAVLVLGVIFGSLVAVLVFGRGSVSASNSTPSAASNSQPGSFQQAFDGSFKNSCKQAAMRSGRVSSTAAEGYCDCALSVFKRTHNALEVVESCKQHLVH